MGNERALVQDFGYQLISSNARSPEESRIYLINTGLTEFALRRSLSFEQPHWLPLIFNRES